jgi:hypothetical protein
MRLRPRVERRSRRQQQQRDALFDLPGGGSHAHVPRSDYGAQSGAHEAREGKTMTQQALPPSVDQQLADARTASAQAQVRIAELEAIVVKERARADRAVAELKTRTQDFTRLIEEAQTLMRPQAEWEQEIAAIKQAVIDALTSVDQEQRAGAVFDNPMLAVSARCALAWIDLDRAALAARAGAGEA